jgi:hypothetical protein
MEEAAAGEMEDLAHAHTNRNTAMTKTTPSAISVSFGASPPQIDWVWQMSPASSSDDDSPPKQGCKTKPFKYAGQDSGMEDDESENGKLVEKHKQAEQEPSDTVKKRKKQGHMSGRDIINSATDESDDGEPVKKTKKQAQPGIPHPKPKQRYKVTPTPLKLRHKSGRKVTKPLKYLRQDSAMDKSDDVERKQAELERETYDVLEKSTCRYRASPLLSKDLKIKQLIER